MQSKEESQMTEQPVEHSSKKKVVRDTFVFQLKLLGDGLRDIFLSPLSIIAGLAGIIIHPSKPDYYLRKLMYFGHKTDRWLNLFGTYGRHPTSTDATSDTYVKEVEAMLVKEYQKSGVAKVVKEGTEKLVKTARHEVEDAKSVRANHAKK